MKKISSNPLLASGGNFNIAESFGVTPTIPLISSAEEDNFLGGPANLVISKPTSPAPNPNNELAVTPSNLSSYSAPTSAGLFSTPMSFFASGNSPANDAFVLTQEDTSTSQSSPKSVSLAAASSPASPPPSLSTPVPPMPDNYLKPNLPFEQTLSAPVTTSQVHHAPPLFLPPTVEQHKPSPNAPLKRPTYAPMPYLNSQGIQPPSSNKNSVSSFPGMPPLPEPKSFQPMVYNSPTSVPLSTSTPNFASPNTSASSNSVTIPTVTAHWFYRVNDNQEIWKPFSVDDSTAIETAYEKGKMDDLIPVDGTRYDVSISTREKRPTYWRGETLPIRRCSWFHRSSTEGRWIPYEEDVSSKLEQEYQTAMKHGRWQCKVVFESGDWVMLHSPEVMMHFPTSSTSSGALDDWGQVQPQSDPSLKPQVVHRGLEGLPDIPDGESIEVDHLVFVVHGIGAACDIKFRPIADVVDGFRELTEDISAKHFAGAHLASKANRIEFLPVSWHDKLHGEDTGTDSRIQPLTLRSIPKLRSFVNDTLLDVLFYTSPLYCQTILDTVCGEINRMYKLFCSRNPGYGGGCSVVGHSLGSLILFDLLSGQEGSDDFPDEDDELLVKPRWDKDLNIEEVFSKLEIVEHLTVFSSQGITMEELVTCSEDDLKEAGLPLGPRKKLMVYLENRNSSGKKSGFEEFKASTVARQVSYSVGPAGTGQPSVRYPHLDIKPSSFFALGSPTSMFMAVRGIDSLGRDFKFPTCKNFYNIFHPYDPVAYRIESLVDREFSELRPLVVPHHQGRKRMHLELKETMSRVGTDIKQRVMESLKATMGAVYSVAGTLTGQVENAVENEIKNTTRSESPIQEQVLILPANMNDGKRIDYVLQEAPLESFNEYLFALASHLCYWESEDTSLMILKEIYGSLGVTADSELLDNSVSDPNNSNIQSSQQFTSTYMPKATSEPTNMSQFNLHPNTMYSPSFNQSQGLPPKLFDINSMPSTSTAPKQGSSYPRPLPNQGLQMSGGENLHQPQMGMDPTAPISMDRPIAPPPTMGFTR